MLPPWLGIDESMARALSALWPQLLEEPSMISAVLEDVAAPAAQRVQGWGVTMILPRAFTQALSMHDRPAAFLTRRVYRALLDDEFALMSDREIGAASARGDLDMFIMHFSLRGHDLLQPQAQRTMAMANDAFRTFHDGYNPQAIYYETSAGNEPFSMASGFERLQFRDEASLAALLPEQRPALFGLTRAGALKRMPGPPARNAFEHQAPLFGFSASQRRLLWFALFDDSDEALMGPLDVSIHGLKKLWRGIYERIEDRMPEFFGEEASGDEGRRGPEKRRQVLAYVRQRPEELRPWQPEDEGPRR